MCQKGNKWFLIQQLTCTCGRLFVFIIRLNIYSSFFWVPEENLTAQLLQPSESYLL